MNAHRLGSALLMLAIVWGRSVEAQTLLLPESMPKATATIGSAVDTRLIQAHALNAAVTAQIDDLGSTTEKAISLLTLNNLIEGQTEVSVKTVAVTSLIDEHTVNVKVNYEHRPIGGILNVQVSMCPSFRGIGISTRPTLTKSLAQAVDQLDESIVKGMVRDLTTEIKAEFARHEESKSSYGAKRPD